MLKAPVDLGSVSPVYPEGSSWNLILLFVFKNLPPCSASSQDIMQTAPPEVLVSPLLIDILESLIFISPLQLHNELGSVLLQPKQLQKFDMVRGDSWRAMLFESSCSTATA